MNESTRITNKNFLEAELSYKIQGVVYAVAISMVMDLKNQFIKKRLKKNL